MRLQVRFVSAVLTRIRQSSSAASSEAGSSGGGGGGGSVVYTLSPEEYKCFRQLQQRRLERLQEDVSHAALADLDPEDHVGGGTSEVQDDWRSANNE